MRTLARFALSLALVLFATAARASDGINLRWDHCLGDGGVLNKNFACDTNSGTDVLVCSFVVARDVPQVSGQQFQIVVYTQTALPSWWEFVNTGACRQSALGMNTVAPAGPSCIDWAQSGPALGGIGAYVVGRIGPNSAFITGATGVPVASDLSAGQEYVSANLTITHAKTVGAGSCAGCATPACIVFGGMTLTSAFGDLMLTGPTNGIDSFWVTWQGGTVFTGGGVSKACPFPVPTRRSTWGSVKALYR